MAKILQLPVELLDAIAKQSGNGDIKSLVYVCRIFNVMTTPYFYRHISLRHRTLPDLQPLLCTLVAHPELGVYVRVLTIEFCDRLDKIDLSVLPHPVPSQRRELAVNAAARGFSNEIQVALANGSISAMLFVLFYFTPVLESLKFLPMRPLNDFLFHWVYWRANRNSCPFSRSCVLLRDTLRKRWFGWLVSWQE